MDSYEAGKLVGQVLTYIILIGAIWLFFKLLSTIKNKLMILLFSNPAKETIKTYLFWVDFAQGIKSTDEFKKKLKKIKNTKVYHGKFHKTYLTQGEAFSQDNEVQAIKIKEVLKSETYPLFLLERLGHITWYSKEDLKNINKECQVVWMIAYGVLVHMVLKDKTFVYAKDYPEDNQFRYGYIVVYKKQDLMSIYDIEKDKLLLEFEYTSIESLANIVELSKDNKIYEIIDLETNQTLSTSNKKTFPNLSSEIKKKINLSKTELKDYLKLFKTPKTQVDLVEMGLWYASVGVLEVPKGFEEVIEDTGSGTISWEYPVSADIFDMSVELPVTFKKKDGEYVTLGISPEHLILEAEYRKKLKYVNILEEVKKDFEAMQKTFKELFNQELTNEEINYERGGMIGDEAMPLGRYIWINSDCIEYYVQWLPHYRGDSHGYIYKDGTHEHLPTLPQVGEVTQREADLRNALNEKGLLDLW